MLLSALVLSSNMASASCSWDHPGANPYRDNHSDIAAAVDDYKDIPPEQRADLKTKIRVHAYDDVADITATRISGRYEYTDFRDMHSGHGPVCHSVSRAKWTDSMAERGLVFCSAVGASGAENCVIVPTVCDNVARVTRVYEHVRQVPPATDGGGGGGTIDFTPQPVTPTAVVFDAGPLPPDTLSSVPPDRPVYGVPPINWPPLMSYLPPIYIPEPCPCCDKQPEPPPIVVPPPSPVPELPSPLLLLAGLCTLIGGTKLMKLRRPVTLKSRDR
jgi:hypothetical protein